MGKVKPTKRKSRKGKKKETAEVPAVFIFIFQNAFQVSMKDYCTALELPTAQE